jgi:carbon monoxide dehydrogenase subunit G
MRPIEVATHLPAAPEEVWKELERIENHPRWMAEATAVEFVGERRRGIGTRVTVATKIGPFRTTDEMEFTEWDRPRSIAVIHRGLFTGNGRFALETEAEGTRLTWAETVRFPWFFGGPVGAFVARPILARIWRRNLRRLQQRLSAP